FNPVVPCLPLLLMHGDFRDLKLLLARTSHEDVEVIGLALRTLEVGTREIRVRSDLCKPLSVNSLKREGECSTHVLVIDQEEAALERSLSLHVFLDGIGQVIRGEARLLLARRMFLRMFSWVLLRLVTSAPLPIDGPLQLIHT